MNSDDYGPKALAWYTSGFKDRSHFETVEFSLWYYGPWFHMLKAYLQSFDHADRISVRHATTFIVGLLGLAALLPIGRIAIGQTESLPNNGRLVGPTSNALRPPPNQRRGKIEEISVHRAIWAVEADCHRENSRSDQHALSGTAAWDQPAPDIALDHERNADCRQG